MKKLVALIAMLVVSLLCFTACNTTPADKMASIEKAEAYLMQMYADAEEETSEDYTLVRRVVIGGRAVAVQWELEVLTEGVAEDIVKLVVGADRSVTVDIPEETGGVWVEYVLKATVSSVIESRTCEFKRTVPPYARHTIPEALEAADDTFVKVTGKVIYVDTAWDPGYGNISVTIADDEENYLYVYRLSTEVEPGDTIEIKGKMTTYGGKRQVAQGCTAEIISSEKDYVVKFAEMTIAEASAKKDCTLVAITGTVTKITSEWSDQYKNMEIEVTDDTGTLAVYRIGTKVELNDIIVVKGKMDTHDGARQIAQGATAEIIGKDEGGNEGGGDTPVVPPVESEWGVVEAPVAGTAYKFGMVQSNVSATDVYYLAGGMSGFYMATTTDKAAAIDVYLEETTGGYHLYAMVDGAKKYINMVVSGTHVNGAYEATASTVYAYNADSKTVIAVVNDTEYWFGTRNDKEYTTVGPCAVSYAGFYCKFYGEVAGGSDTPAVCEHEGGEATCEAKAICSKCGEAYGELGDHAWNVTIEKQPTCVEAGKVIKTCGVCGETETVTEIDPNGHTPVVDAAVAPTCTTTGLTEGSHCDVCGAVIVAQETVAVIEHAWDAGVPTAPTCEEDGYTTYTCTTCPAEATPETKKVVDEGTATGHNWVKPSLTKVPTCTANGEVTYTCANGCGETDVIVLEMLPHTDVDPEDGMCEVCGNCAHKTVDAAVKENVVDPDCTEAGSYDSVVYCSVCDAELSRETIIVDALGHDYQNATCLNNGVCEECGAIDFSGEYVLGLYQANLGKTLYFTGAMSGYYFGTTESVNSAAIINIEYADGGYNLTFTASGTKKYIYVQVSGTYTNLKFGSTKGLFVWNEEIGIFTTKVNNTDYYMGTYNNYNTISPSKTSYITGSNASKIGVSQFVARLVKVEDHVWNDATCTAAKTCATCGLTEGAALGHTGGTATCEAKAVCGVCGKEYGSLAAHNYVNGACSVCGEEDPSVGGEVEPVVNYADFSKFTTATSYTTHTTSDKLWTAKNSQIVQGGSSNNSSSGTFIVLGDSKAAILNGKTSAKGSLTSATLTGGISKLSLSYANVFSETNGVDITINIKVGGTVVATTKVDNNSVNQYQEYTYEWTLDSAITGDFVIEIVNNSPSNSSKNKDRVAIWNISWTSAN